MIMPIDIDKKEFTRDKRGYNSREVDEFLDLIIVDYEKALNDNRNMAHKIKFLEKQLEDAQKSDTAMVETLETAKRLMADISASAERRAELMIRDAELEAETMVLDAKATVRKLNDEHVVLANKVARLKANIKFMLEKQMSALGKEIDALGNEIEAIDNDEFGLLADIDRSDLPEIEKEFGNAPEAVTQDTIVVDKIEEPAEEPVEEESLTSTPITDPARATVSDLSDSLKQMAEEQTEIDDTIILK